MLDVATVAFRLFYRANTIIPLYAGNSGQCLNQKAHRSAPGGGGAGGSVVIFTKELIGDPKSKISVSGGAPVKCAFGTGGGE